MTITVEGIYENGVLNPTQSLPLAEHEKVEVVVRTPIEVQAAMEAVARTYGILQWKGDPKVIERIALDPEFGIEESP